MTAGWEADAACRGLDPAIFFPSDAGGVAAAKRICAACPVVAECLEAHMGEVDGVWGGLSAQQRLQLRERGRYPHRIVFHGTHRSYVDGCRCDECKEAHRVFMRGYMTELRRRRRLEAAS